MTLRNIIFALLAAFALQGCSAPPAALPSVEEATVTRITDIRIWHAPERSRIVLAMDKRPEFEVSQVQSPPRVTIDVAAARANAALPQIDTGQFIRRLHRDSAGDKVRLIFDLRKPVRYVIQMLPAGGRYQNRLIVDFYDRDSTPAKELPAEDTPRPPRRPGSEVLVLIDPGHGGEDPGALGRRAQEKQVVLQIAKKLKALIDRRPGLRAELTRDGDYYVGLRERTRIARRLRADLFVAIHADGFKSPTARGASVYALSDSGASSEAAKWLANKENAADLAGGVKLADKDAQLAEVLLDLSMTDTVRESLAFGGEVLAELAKIGRVHFAQVEQAGFAVLKSPDIPSILVETAYMTNPSDEKLLMNESHQRLIAAAIVGGIERYLSKSGDRYVDG